MCTNDDLKPRVGLLWVRGITPPCLVKNAFKLILMAFLLINFSQSVYSQVKGKWKFPVNLVLSPDYYNESRVIELWFGVDTIYYSLESQKLRNDDLLTVSGFQGYPDNANFNFFNYYDSLYRNPFDLREDTIFVNGQRTAMWGKDYAALYYESFRRFLIHN